MQSEQLFRVLDGVQAQVRAFDTKAQIILGIDGLILGFLSLNGAAISSAVTKKLPTMLAIGLGAAYLFALITLVFSLYFAFATVRPRTDFGQPTSRLFFAHLVARYGKNYCEAKRNLAAMTEEELCADIGEQILANAHVCSRKAVCLRRAMFCLQLSSAAWVATLCAVILFAAIHGWLVR